MKSTLRRLAPCGLLLVASCSGCEDTGGFVSLEPGLSVNPLVLDLGEVPLGVRAQGVFTVRSRGDAPLMISRLELEETDIFQIVNETARALAPAQSDVVQVAARPMTLGMHETVLVIESNDSEAPRLDIPVRVTAVEQPPCDDLNVCTTDVFDTELARCTHSFADGTACEAADKCIINAVCSQGVCLGASKTCDDGSVCTRDLCRQIDGECIFIDNELACEDDNPCTADLCGPTGCEHVALSNGTACDDGDLCTQGDACFAGACVGTGMPDGTACDDLDSCTVEDTCRAGVCSGTSIVASKAEGEHVFTYDLTAWPERAFLHRREVSMSDDGVFYGLDHLNLPNNQGLTHVVFAFSQCGTPVYEFAYRPPDAHVLVSYVRRAMQIGANDEVRMVVGVRQQPQNGFEPQTTTYLLDDTGQVLLSGVQALGGETGRALLPDGSYIFGTIWPLSSHIPSPENPSRQNLVVVREDVSGNVLWRHERESGPWAEFLGVAGPRVLFWALGRFGALDFNTGATVWSQETPFITKEMALATGLNLGVARANDQLIGVEILNGTQVFRFPEAASFEYVARTDPVISADGRVLVMMERRNTETFQPETLSWVVLDAQGQVVNETPLPYVFPADYAETRHEDYFDDPSPTVADDGVAYIGYGDTFWAIDPTGNIRWTYTSTVENAFTGTVPLLRDDGVMLINETSRRIIGIRTNGGQMSDDGWASFRHDNERTNFTP
ncbi:MAG: PQQ-binding-like beta-propeller repeat protein [Deltaproteobacteria bacterium]|jgi:hypothetical protein